MEKYDISLLIDRVDSSKVFIQKHLISLDDAHEECMDDIQLVIRGNIEK
ncbi:MULTISPECIES: hypothetical protein [Bacillus]|nr:MULTISPECIES: hypothetical protein [Bacillus]MDR4917839.1 hypothetical protein [Bacillus pseudomycoides]